MKRNLRLNGALAAAGLCLMTAGAIAQQSGPIKIAATLPLSGGAANFGQAARNGADMALAEVNGAGGVLSRQVVMDVQDNRCNPTEAVKVVTQMLSDGGYSALFDGLCSSVVLASMPVVDRAQIPYMVATASATAISEKSGVGGSKWTFKFNPTDASMAAAMVSWLTEKGLADKIAFLGEDTDFGRSGGDGFKAALKARGKALLSEDYYQQGTADFSATLTKYRTSRPGVVGIYALASDQQNIVNQMQAFGVKVPLSGRVQTDSIAKELLESGFLDGTSAVQPYSPEIDTPKNQAFVAAFKEKYGSAPNSISYSAYESMRTLLDAIHRAGSTEPEKIRTALTQAKFPTLLGGEVSFDEYNLAHTFAVIFQIEGGKAKVVGLSKT